MNDIPLDSPLAHAPLTEPPLSMEQQINELVERVGEITEIAQGAKRRARYALYGALVIVLVGIAIAIGSLVTNVAIRDIKGNNDAAICRSNISGAYTSLESTRDNAFILGVLAQQEGNTVLLTKEKRTARDAAREIDALPPRQLAYVKGVTVEDIHYPPCEGSKVPPSTTR